MKTKKSLSLPFAILIIAFSLVMGCKKDDSGTNEDDPKTPVLTTNEVTLITQVSALSGGAITDDGGRTITARGVCWSSNDTPTIADNKTEDGDGTGVFSSLVEGLIPETTYYVRAYATNSQGTGYGTTLSFKTLEAVLPVISTSPVINIKSTSASSGGEIIHNEFSNVTARGIVWNTNGSPTIDNNAGITSDGDGIGEFISVLDDLIPLTHYFVRSYATNDAGTSYGNEIEFTTLSGLPLLTTIPVTEITINAALSGGNIESDGGDEVTSRGIVWSINPEPTLDDNFTIDGADTGSYISSISDLAHATDYYLRAYATNSAGTFYGNQISFTTRDGIIVLNTSPVIEITNVSAVSGGNITDDGGGIVNARGIVWGTDENPTVENNEGISNNGTGTGSYVSNLTALNTQTIYYARAYAINNIGTVYGDSHQFRTFYDVIADIDGNSYGTVLIGTQEWMAENLKTTYYRNKIQIEYPGNNSSAWFNNTNGAYAWYINDYSNKDIYGALYNGHAVNNPNGLCPSGWHVPSDDEWKILEGTVDSQYGVGHSNWDDIGLRGSDAGKKLKATAGWSNNGNGTDDYGFAALAGAFRNSMGQFHQNGDGGSFWSATMSSSASFWHRSLGYGGDKVNRHFRDINSGLSVRCLKD